MIERVYRGYGKSVTPLLCAPFEHESEQPTDNVIRGDIIPTIEGIEGNSLPKQGCSIVATELIFGQVIYNSHWCFKINNMREKCQGYDFNRSHEICAKIQNKLQGLILSSGPPSRARNVDNVGLANI